jgi:hypothetical protein
MAMSSLVSSQTQSLFVVQSGIVAWEDPEPIADWRWKTVSVGTAQLSLLGPVIWAIVSSRPSSLRSVFRFHTSPTPVNVGVMLTRRLVESLRKDAPGLGGTYVTSVGDRICVASELIDAASVDLNYLSAYRSSILLQTDSTIGSPADLCKALCGAVVDLGGAGIARLLDCSVTLAALRIVEHESHAVVQLVGSFETTMRAVQTLIERGVRQIHDVRTLSTEIARLRR